MKSNLSLAPAFSLAALSFSLTLFAGCAGSQQSSVTPRIGMPSVVAHSEWEVHPPLGHDADATRRNLGQGDSIRFQDLTLIATRMSSATSNGTRDSVEVEVSMGGDSAMLVLAEGKASTWNGYRLAVVAIHLDEDELGEGLAEFEIAVDSSVPEEVRTSGEAGGPAERLRVSHTITHVTLHHSGSAEPLRPDDDVPQKLRDLQTWGETDRGWWDVPYHFLLGLDGTIYEGRSYRYMGETNTRYNPRGHLLISVLGNYNLQEPTDAQLESIVDLMAWAVSEFGIPLDRIQGHSDLAPTACPGDHLRKYLHDGTFRQAVQARLDNTSS
ncbi:MAG: peptidoglycan recognition family protein [Rhodothermales bacterium]|nr:peptidoglycan recognition family protein [Rhodothermales bacterium]